MSATGTAAIIVLGEIIIGCSKYGRRIDVEKGTDLGLFVQGKPSILGDAVALATAVVVLALHWQ